MFQRRMSQAIQAKVMFIEERNIQKLNILKVGNNCQKLWDNFDTNMKQLWDKLRQL